MINRIKMVKCQNKITQIFINNYCMRQHEKKNVISMIQNNLKQMQKQAQVFLQKHHNSTLPPICTARHYLFHSFSKNQNQANSPSGLNTVKNQKQQPGSQKLQKSIDKQMQSKLKTSVYNLQFAKKSKLNEIAQRNRSYNLRASLMNSTSIRLKMSGNFRTSRYLNDFSRANLQTDSSQKLKTIIMNSQIIGLAEKDLKINNNSNSYTPKISGLTLPKRQTDVLQKYLTKFKQPKSQQIKSSHTNLQDIANKSSQILQTCFPKQVLPDNQHCSRRRRSCRKTIDNPQSASMITPSLSRAKIQKQLLRITKIKNKEKKKQKEIDIMEGDCTPWNHNERVVEQVLGFDFS